METKLTAQEIVDCRTDFLTFVKTVFKDVHGSEFVENWHHVKICDTLTNVVIGKIKRLIVNIPPRYSKTEICFVMFVAWTWGIFPDSKYLHISHAVSLAQENMLNLKSVLDSDAFRQIFPDFALSKEVQTDMQTPEGGKVYGSGAEGGLIGKGCGALSDDGLFHGCAIIDDPIKAEEAHSDTVRDKVNKWYTRSFMSRVNFRATPVIVIMQRLHQNDLAGFLSDGGSNEEWEELIIPVWDEDKKPLWNFKHTYDELVSLKEADPYTFAGQMEQRPSPEGGGIFKEHWWQYYDEDSLPVLISKRIYADTALKTKERNDFSVFQCWGKCANGRIYFLDQMRGKWEAPELEVNARAFYNKHNVGYTPVSSFNVEDKASGTGLIQSLKREGIPIVAIQRHIDKVTRAHNCTGLLQSGNVYLNKNWEGLSDFLAEVSTFPNATHDDQVDPMMDALPDLLRTEIFEDYGDIL